MMFIFRWLVKKGRERRLRKGIPVSISLDGVRLDGYSLEMPRQEEVWRVNAAVGGALDRNRTVDAIPKAELVYLDDATVIEGDVLRDAVERYNKENNEVE